MNHTEHEAATSTTEIKSIPAKSDNKLLLRPCIMVVVLLLLMIIPMLVQYVIYLNGQKEAIKLVKQAYPYSGYDDMGRTEMLEEMYGFFNDRMPLTGATNLKADQALGDALSAAGFHTDRGSHYLKHTNLFAYLKGEHPIQFYLTGGLLLFLLILYLIVSSLVSSNRRKEICVKDDLVVCTSGAGQKLELLPSDIVGAEVCFPNCLRIRSTGITFTITGIANAEELKDRILAMRAAAPQPVTIMHNEMPQSNADELKKYKELLDSGVITKEEFDTKKKQLLGL